MPTYFHEQDAGYSHSALARVTAPTLKALTLGEIKSQLHLSGNTHDVWLKSTLEAAAKYVEGKTNRALLDQEWDAYFDRFPVPGNVIELPKPALISVTSVKYTDTAGVVQTWPTAEYVVDVASERGRIWEAHGYEYPSPRVIRHAVIVRFKCGYATSDDIPEDLKLAMLMLVAHWFNHREAVVNGVVSNDVEMGVDSLLADHLSQRFF